ncbi:MAG: hypothetical protein HQL72_10175 [Magnetococcales bacterium]|nr:hypothetical protein [Magnetococcales bacterium]
MVSTGMNGFGRFGLHLLKYWLDRRKCANFSIDYINDDYLSPQEAYAILLNDRFVRIPEGYTVSLDDHSLSFVDPSGESHALFFSHTPKEQIPWRGKPQLLLECSGKYCDATLNRPYLEGHTDKVIISATVANADQTLIVGFNLQDYDPNAPILSYGSCIINAFVPLTHWIHQQFQLQDCDTSVIHNTPEYQLLRPENQTLHRRPCSLQWMGPTLLPYLTPDNFTVLKTYIPHPGISLIDMRYRLTKPPAPTEMMAILAASMATGPLKDLYSFDQPHATPESHLNSPYSAVLRTDGVQLVGDNLYLSCFFDNENSVNRYFDLVNHISKTS